MLGLLLPIGVWMGEERFGAGFLWTLPGRSALARAREGVRRVGVVDGRGRAVGALAACAHAVLGRERDGRGDASSAAIFPFHGRRDNRSARGTDSAMDAATAYLARPLHRGDRQRTCSPARWHWERGTRCCGSSGRCSASCSSSASAEESNAEWLATARRTLLEGALRRTVRARRAPHREDRILEAKRRSRAGKHVVVWRALPDPPPVGDGHAALDRRRPGGSHGPRPRDTESAEST